MDAETSVNDLAQIVQELDPSCLSGTDASKLMAVFERGEKLCAAAKGLLAARASDTREWSRAGARSAEDWLADRWGVSSTDARTALRTAETASRQPEFEEALRAGSLSADQASEIAGAAKSDPSSTRRLIETAKSRSLRGLKEQAKSVRLAGRSAEDDQAHRERLHRDRYLRYWTDSDGAGRLDARLAPDAYARFLAGLSPFEREVIDSARREGRREEFRAYKADALLAMAEAAVSAGGDEQPKRIPATVVAVVDHAALVRGHTDGEERSYIDGVGPVPVSTIRAMVESEDPFLAAVVEDATDIRAVCYPNRHVSRKQRLGLIVRDPCCSVPGCDVTHGLERDHFPPFEQSRHTRIDELRRVCQHHHAQITNDGATLTGRPGHWVWTPPPPGPFDDPDPFGPDPFGDPGPTADPDQAGPDMLAPRSDPAIPDPSAAADPGPADRDRVTAAHPLILPTGPADHGWIDLRFSSSTPSSGRGPRESGFEPVIDPLSDRRIPADRAREVRWPGSCA